MKSATYVLLSLLLLPSTHTNCKTQFSALTGPALDYILASIEYEVSVSSGIFRCVFYDISPQNSTNGFFTELLRSPRLNSTQKYVISGQYSGDWEALPWSPSLLLVYPGDDPEHAGRDEIQWSLHYALSLFNPTTKVLVFSDLLDVRVMHAIRACVATVRFGYSVYFDSVEMRIWQCNPVWCWNQPTLPHQMFLFTWMGRYRTGHDVTYYVTNAAAEKASNTEFNWMTETARFLNTEARQYRTNCEHLQPQPEEYYRCMQNQSQQLDQVDIKLSLMASDAIGRDFRHLFTTIPVVAKIGVPRDRPVNNAELMVMPFNWQVWLLLLTFLVLTEAANYLRPGLFENDPILLVVCGFERHNLHQTSRFEKLVLLSLIVLMFFMSNAFETKVISFMINRPSIQRIKTVEDLSRSGIKFYYDLEHTPQFVTMPVIGALTVQGYQNFYETIPGAGRMVFNYQVDVLDMVAYDYERMQPFYVFLEPEYFLWHELYRTSHRCPLREVFRSVHAALVEAGLVEQWLRWWKLEVRALYIGRRVRESIADKDHLNFDDLQPAWLALAIGLAVSVVGFAWEQVASRIAGSPGLF